MPTEPMDMEQSLKAAQLPELIAMMSLIMLGEARGEGLEGMAPIGNVIMNRIGHPWFGEDAKSVMEQQGHFESLSADVEIPDDVRGIAEAILSGAYVDETGGATNFHSFEEGAEFIPESWGDAEAYQFLKSIGGHHFYSTPNVKRKEK